MGNNYFFLTNQLNEVETGVVTSIIRHIENGEKKINVAQIAQENYVSPAFLVKMGKKLGFNGYTDMVYNIAQSRKVELSTGTYGLETLLDNYSEELVERFLSCLRDYGDRKMFVIGSGLSNVAADYIAQRLSTCGFMVYDRVHFYDYMVFQDDKSDALQNNVAPSVIIAISQTGETYSVLRDVRRARQNGFKVVSFCKIRNSTLAGLSDIAFIIDSAEQTLISPLPNPFFGKVILSIEEMLAKYFSND